MSWAFRPLYLDFTDDATTIISVFAEPCIRDFVSRGSFSRIFGFNQEVRMVNPTSRIELFTNCMGTEP